MLAVAIDSHQAVVSPRDGLLEGAFQAGAVALILGVANHLDRGKVLEQVGSAVGRAVVDYENVGRIIKNLGQNRFEVSLFVKNRDGCQHSHRCARLA